jgi:hypothetical protein
LTGTGIGARMEFEGNGRRNIDSRLGWSDRCRGAYSGPHARSATECLPAGSPLPPHFTLAAACRHG